MKPLTVIRYIVSTLALALAAFCGVQVPGAIDRLVMRENLPPLQKSDSFGGMLVVIDPGHGGHDGGATANQGLEKALALEMGKRLRDYLIDQGFKVIMTRDTDVFVELEERCAISNRARADLFVSLHLNANAESSETAGVETYFCSRKTLGDVARLRRERNLPEGVSLHDRRSEWLANLIHQNVCHFTGAADRGVRDSGYLVARLTESPAVLVECGYLTNASECGRLRDKSYQQKLAMGVGEAVVRYARATSMNPRRGIEYEGNPTRPVLPLTPQSLPPPAGVLSSAPAPSVANPLPLPHPAPTAITSELAPALLPALGQIDKDTPGPEDVPLTSPPAPTASPPANPSAPVPALAPGSVTAPSPAASLSDSSKPRREGH